MSLFVAIQPDEAAVAHLDDALERVRREPQAQGLHWQPTDRWHVTLAFLGDVDAGRAPALCDRLDAVGTATAPITGLRLSGSGVFGRRILWVALSVARAPEDQRLAALGRRVADGMRREHVTIERRTWQPHLTVARARQGDGTAAATLLADYRGPLWTLDRLALVHSTGGPAPVYRTFHTTTLSGQRCQLP